MNVGEASETREAKAFDGELSRLDYAIARIEGEALSTPLNAEKATKFVYLLYQRAGLYGLLEGYQHVEEVLQTILTQVGPAGDLYLLKANLDFKFHRLEAVEYDLQADDQLRNGPDGRALYADLAFQRGAYRDAQLRYEALVDTEHTWDSLARLAYFKFKMGDFAEADAYYVRAEDELTAKEMRHFAWLELQRGVLRLRQGRIAEAGERYDTADRAYPGYWLVDEHRAELLGAQRRYREAAAAYESVATRVPRPEFHQALSELYGLLDDNERAVHYRDKALAAYLQSANHGGVHYYHHLADFYSDMRNGPEALLWAQKDVALRRNFATVGALAWAYYLNGAIPEAIGALEEALESGVADAHLFAQAARIFGTTGADARAEQYLDKASAINPQHGSFHVHR